MSLENEGRRAAEPLESAGIRKEISKRSRIVYTREFLLSTAELDVCKQLPGGFEMSILRKLEDASKGILEQWKESCVSSGNNPYRLLEFTKLNSWGNYLESGGRSDRLPLMLNQKSNFQEDYVSDFKSHDDLAQCLLKASGYKSDVTGQKIQEIKNGGYYQLSKSKNPYRPPPSYKVDSRELQAKALPKKTISIEKMECANQEERQLLECTVSSDEEHKVRSSSVPLIEYTNNTVIVSFPEKDSCDPVDVVKSSCHTFDSSEANDAHDIKCFKSKKVSTSAIRRDIDEELSRMILKEQVGCSLKVRHHCSSAVAEKPMPQPLTENSQFKVGLQGKLRVHRNECCCSMLKSSSEDNNSNSQTNQLDKPTSETKQNGLLDTGESYSAQRGSFNRTSRTDISEPYEFSIPIAYDCFTSALREYDPTEDKHKNLTSADVAADTELYEMDENESTFDDLWAEIFAAIRLEQEMELTPVSQYDQTADFEVQVCLPDEDSLISSDYATSTVDSKIVPLNSSTDFANSYADIPLPDENSLISVDDLIAPHYSKLTADRSSVKNGILTSDARDKVGKQQGALAIADDQEGSAIQVQEVPPFLHTAAPVAHWEPYFQSSFLLNHYTGSHPEMPAFHPFNSQEVQMGMQTSFMDPMAIHCSPAFNYYSFTKMLYQPSKKLAHSKSTESSSLVSYALLHHPACFP